MTALNRKTGSRAGGSISNASARRPAGFSASPIAAAGRIYLTSEDGDVFVVRAGPKFELLATNKLGEITMATPAVSGSMLIVRARSGFIGVREGGRTPK